MIKTKQSVIACSMALLSPLVACNVSRPHPTGPSDIDGPYRVMAEGDLESTDWQLSVRTNFDGSICVQFTVPEALPHEALAQTDACLSKDPSDEIYVGARGVVPGTPVGYIFGLIDNKLDEIRLITKDRAISGSIVRSTSASPFVIVYDANDLPLSLVAKADGRTAVTCSPQGPLGPCGS